VALASVVASIALAGCAGSELDANPLYVGRVHDTPRGEDARMTSLGPLWDDAVSPDRRETALHPFWRRVVTPTETRTQILPPLIASRTTADEQSTRLLALSFARSHVTSLDGVDENHTDFMLFPLLWWGHGGQPTRNYFALFPLLGRIEGFAGFAEVGFVLFPLYYYAKKDVTTPETFESITPLVGWIHGGPRDGSVHVLPLFGHWKYEGKYDKWSVLWPVVHWQHNRLDTSDPSTDVTVWPLFGIETSARMRFLAFLWPFFRFRTERATKLDSEGKEHEEVYYEQDFLWPLFRRSHDREADHLRLFPFYARYHSAELDSQTFAIPLFWKRQVREEQWTKDTFDFVPLVHWERKQWKEQPGQPRRVDDGQFKLWPLFVAKDDAGAHETTVPALLPLDAEQYTGDFLAAWGPLVQLWHTRDEPGGDWRGDALLRLVDWDHDARSDRTRFSLPIAYSLDTSPRRTTHSFLFGAIRFGGGEGGAELKVLGLPILTPDAPARAKDGSR
jgi:hypothetical protein